MAFFHKPSGAELNRGPEWWRGAAIYQVYPRSFQDSNGDGVGDLAGATERLPYLADLGIDGVWISPFYRSPMRDFGYDVSDYRSVDPLFGTMADFDRLVSRAHSLGLKVLIDQVLSHTSEDHPWFQESRTSRENPKADWYVWADPRKDGTAPTNWLSLFGGSAWAWDPRRRQYYFHNFLVSQPDLNFHHPPVQDRILDEVRFWLDRGVDGFRFDACNFHFHDKRLRDNPPAAHPGEVTTVRPGNPYGFQVHKHDKSQPENLVFLQRLRRLMDAYGAVGLGELGEEDCLPIMAQYTSGGDKLHLAYGFNLLTDHFSAGRIRQVVSDFERLARQGSGWACWSFSNHDVERVVSRWGRDVDDPAFPKVLMALLASLGGSFCIYQGDELGLPQVEVPYERLADPYGIAFWPDFKGRDGCRIPMPWTSARHNGGFSKAEPWLPVPDHYLTRAVDLQESDPHSMLSFSRRLLAWRRTQPALCRGLPDFLEAPEPLLALRREAEGHVCVAVFNLGPESATLSLPCGLEPLVDLGLPPARMEGRTLHLAPWAAFYGQPT